MSNDNQDINSQNIKNIEALSLKLPEIDLTEPELDSSISSLLIDEEEFPLSVILRENNYYKMVNLFNQKQNLLSSKYHLNYHDLDFIVDGLLKNNKAKDIIDLLDEKKDLLFLNHLIEKNKISFFNHIYSTFILNNLSQEDLFKNEQEFYFIKLYNLIIKNDNEPNTFDSIYTFYNHLFSYILAFDLNDFLLHFYFGDEHHESFIQIYNKNQLLKYEYVIPIEESSLNNLLLQDEEISEEQNKKLNELIKLYFKNATKLKNIIKEYVNYSPKKQPQENIKNDNTVSLFDFDDISQTLKTLPEDVADKKIIELIKTSHIKKLKSNELLLKNINELKENFPNFSKFLNFIEEESFLNELSLKRFSLPPALLVGEPGIGKTFLLTSFNDMMNNQNYFLDMGSVTAGMVLSGSSEKWGNGSPGYILNTLLNSEFANPLIILDEIDKISESYNSPVIPSLLTLLEKHTAKRFKDEYCSIRVDASHINWIGTANDKDRISAPLKSRFSIFDIPSPNKSERIIFSKQVFDKICKNKGLTNMIEQLSSEFLEELCKDEGSTRDISRVLTLSISSAAKRRNNKGNIVLLPEDIKPDNFNDKKKYGFI